MLDIQAEWHDAGQPYHDLYEAVAELKRRHDLHPCSVRPRDGLSLRDDGERETVQDLVSRFRRLPEDTRRKLPALWNSLAQLEVVVGDLDASLADFQEVARLVSDPLSRAEAHHNVYRAALERRDWDAALAALRRAVALEPETFEPFPFSRLEPRKILGAGGSGVSFLCTDHARGDQDVVVKALRADSLDRDSGVIFTEAASLQDLDHPSLIGVLDVGFGGQRGTSNPPLPPRPYLVLEHFDGVTLAEYVAKHGPLPPEDWFDVAWPILRAVQALHGRGILHRAMRPACILVRPQKNRDGRTYLACRLLDTGLVLKRTVIHACASNPEACRHSGVGRSVARLLPYAPPEVVGRPKGHVWVGPHSDLWSFGRVCAFGLTGQADPDPADRLLMPDAWQKLLDECTAWTIGRRPQHVGILLEQLAQLPGVDEQIGRIERDVNEATVAGLTARLEANPEDVQGYLQRATVHFRQGDLPGALADYTEALRLRPEDASLYRRRGLVHARANEPDEAIADYTESLRLEPRTLEALANRGLAYSQKGEHDKAIADYTEGLYLNHRDEVLYYNRGNAHYCKGDYGRAIADYTEALRLDPRGLWSLSNRGKAYLLQDEPARAVADFTRLLQLDPGNVKVLCDRAEANLDLGRVEVAIADYTEAIRLGPTAALYHERGLARATGGDLAGAIADYTEALTHSPDNAAILQSRGKAHVGQKLYDEAIADYSEALRIAPQSVGALFGRSEAYQLVQRNEEALADLTAAVAVAQGGTSALSRRGQLYAKLGDDDRAVADFTEVIRLDPAAAEAWAARGQALVRLDELDRAVTDFDRALSLQPNDGRTLARRADVLRQLGDALAALAGWGEVLRLDPANAGAYHARARLRAELDDVEGAITDLEACLRLEPTNVPALYLRAGLYAKQERLPQALADYTAVLAAKADWVEAWVSRGGVHLRMGQPSLALADNLAALALVPDDPRVCNNLAWLYATQLGEPALALEYATKALAAGETAERLDTLAAVQAAQRQGRSSDGAEV